MRALVTGAAGFAGSHAVRHFLTETTWDLVLPVSFDHRGTPHRIESAVKGFDPARYRVVSADLAQPISSATTLDFGQVDFIINYASQSHVDRSITDPAPFIMNNVALVVNMLEFARTLPGLSAFVQISTDETMGPALSGQDHKEWAPVVPSNPYSGSKAAQEAIAISFWRTYNVPLLITNTMNLFGEMQDPEKFIPMCVSKIQSGEVVPIHASADGSVIGSRYYLHARNLADAVLFLIRRGNIAMYQGLPEDRPDRYHIVGEREINNLEMAQLLADTLGKDLRYELIDFHSSRPGHDIRYGLDGSKLRELGWNHPVSFEAGMKQLIDWEQNNGA